MAVCRGDGWGVGITGVKPLTRVTGGIRNARRRGGRARMSGRLDANGNRWHPMRPPFLRPPPIPGNRKTGKAMHGNDFAKMLEVVFPDTAIGNDIAGALRAFQGERAGTGIRIVYKIAK